MYSNWEGDKLRNSYLLAVEERNELVLQRGNGIKEGFYLFRVEKACVCMLSCFTCVCLSSML